MSINTLLENPASQSKPWCNLYVDSLTAYKDTTIKGDLNVEGDINGDINLSKLEPPPPPEAEKALIPAAVWNDGTSSYHLAWRSPLPDMISGGLENQVITRDANGYGVWADPQSAPPAPGPNNSLFVTNGSGNAEWSNEVNFDGFFNTTTITINGGSTFYRFNNTGFSPQLTYNSDPLMSIPICYIQVVQNFTTFSLRAFTRTLATSGSAIIMELIPSEYCPSQAKQIPVTVKDNGVDVPGLLNISTSGTFTLSPISGGFTAGDCGLSYEACVSWTMS